jgi:hypothetical protein
MSTANEVEGLIRPTKNFADQSTPHGTYPMTDVVTIPLDTEFFNNGLERPLIALDNGTNQMTENFPIR